MPGAKAAEQQALTWTHSNESLGPRAAICRTVDDQTDGKTQGCIYLSGAYMLFI